MKLQAYKPLNNVIILLLKKTGILLVFVIAWQFSYAYRDKPVLTHLNKVEQNDTFGFNLVKSLPKLVYSLVKADKVKLWDSPQKTIQITFSTLSNIERSSNTLFIETKDLFFNEVWSSTRKKTTFNILGFSFINKNEKGSSVSYGFIDMEDIYLLLADSIIPTNANGTYNVTYLDALYSRSYHFNVVQFGSSTFKNDIAKSLQVKEKAFNKDKRIINKVTLPSAKRVVYEIVKTEKSKAFYKGLQGFLNDNPEFFFNNGGNKIFTHLLSNINFSISKIEIIEAWDKVDGLTTYAPQEMQLYFNNIPLPPISVEKFNQYRFKVAFQDVKSALRIKNFNYLLKQINHEEIPPALSGKYIRAFENYFWTQITEYVKYE